MADFHTIKELTAMTLQQLEALLHQRREHMRHLRFQVASREVKDHRKLRFSRREVARIETVINHKRTA